MNMIDGFRPMGATTARDRVERWSRALDLYHKLHPESLDDWAIISRSVGINIQALRQRLDPDYVLSKTGVHYRTTVAERQAAGARKLSAVGIGAAQAREIAKDNARANPAGEPTRRPVTLPRLKWMERPLPPETE